ncbi:TlpA disulfide reductase family protein [Pontibacter sp. G13]|uniref:TlpA family protein disulfide reductase n=1 Tax=Pontibacter sp. G13 TaxID=3074898 RepID=UPI00288C47C8|nr:TlpA disulfide reductase family protein [Pontibacter sp. G13]WNJ20368.1 TlpA disulfide reductase family protein [Pontibacter sp. G13]
MAKQVQFLWILLLMGCLQGQNLPEESSGPITLIFHDVEVATRFSIPPSRPKALDRNARVITWSPNPTELRFISKDESWRDTLSIDPTTIPMQVNLRYFIQRELSFWVYPGDTLDLRYEGYKPTAEIRNRAIKPYDLNWDFAVDTLIGRDSIPAKDQYMSPVFYIYKYQFCPKCLETQNGMNRIQYVVEMITDTAMKELDRERALIDRLVAEGSLSEEYAELYRQQCQYERQAISWRLGEAESGNLFRDYSPEIARSRQFRHALSMRAMRFYWTAFEEGTSVDWMKAFDEVIVSDQFLGSARIELLDMLFEKIKLSESQETIAEYSGKLEASSGQLAKFKAYDPAHIQTLFSSTLLENGAGDTVRLDEVMTELSGKAVYLDFWSSTCTPCIHEMPSSHKLKKSLEAEPVEIVYLAYDPNPSAWKKMAEKTGVVHAAHQYRILNLDDNPFLEALEVRVLPRYLIFDGIGHLKYAQAPSPSAHSTADILMEVSRATP